MRRSPCSLSQTGFSLLELSVVLAIIAVVITGMVTMGGSMISSVQLVNTNNKLDAIENALMAFRMVNNRLPCPGDATLMDIPANSATYGYAANNTSGNCTGGSPAANFSYKLPSPPANTNIPGNTTVAEGAVPVKTLGLPDEYQWDGWGRKFAYSVWTPLTAANAFVYYGITPSCGAITVQNAGHGYRTTTGGYALISYGPDGHGGYLKTGRRYFMGSDNADEWTNCHCNATADSGNYAATYVEQDVTQSNPGDSFSVFDDIVRFKDRWQMQNAYDTYVPNGASCWPGFRADGVSSGDKAGYSVAVGDVNGDGIPDLIIGAPSANGNAGKVYVVFGTKSGFPDPLPLGSLNGSNGFELDGSVGNDAAGTSVAVGDVNGDGIPDLIIGAYSASPGGNTEAGSVYVVFGGTTGANGNTGTAWTSCPCTLDATYLNGTNGVEFDGAAASDEVGWSVAAGDVNGDGIADLIIGAPNYSGWTGSVYEVFGKRSGWSGTATILNSTFLNGTNGVEFDGVAINDNTGISVAAGDVNGDGIGDLIIGADKVNSFSGAVYVVFGRKCGGSFAACSPADNVLNSTYLNGANGVEFDGLANTMTGYSVAVGDVNGDGIGDLIIGAPWYPSFAGSVYVVFGKKSGWSGTATTLNSAFLNGTNGVEFDGAATNSMTGYSVAVGDVNGDGIGDLIIGAPYYSTWTGSAYVVFGTKGGWSGTATTLNSTFLNGTNGVEFDGTAANNDTGYSVAVGDVNGDGISDLIIGAPGANAGSTYIYFGHKSATTDPWPSSPYNLGGL